MTKRQEQCAICSKVIQRDSEFFPFCSKRCKLVDLSKWFKGDYRISRSAEQVSDD